MQERAHVQPQLYVDRFKWVSAVPEPIHAVARIYDMYINVVGQTVALTKCVLLSTCEVVRDEMKN